MMYLEHFPLNNSLVVIIQQYNINKPLYVENNLSRSQILEQSKKFFGKDTSSHS